MSLGAFQGHYAGPTSYTQQPRTVSFDDTWMTIDLEDGRRISVPIAWFPSLASATPEQRQKCELGWDSLHWRELDEDISVTNLLVSEPTEPD